MKRDILAIDVGTTAFKIGVFSPDLEKRCEASREYEINLYDRGEGGGTVGSVLPDQKICLNLRRKR
jgi:glycerol kinase